MTSCTLDYRVEVVVVVGHLANLSAIFVRIIIQYIYMTGALLFPFLLCVYIAIIPNSQRTFKNIKILFIISV